MYFRSNYLLLKWIVFIESRFHKLALTANHFGTNFYIGEINYAIDRYFRGKTQQNCLLWNMQMVHDLQYYS